MLLSTAVDATIGLLLIYLVLSLVCTSVNEVIAGLFRLRARVLFHEIDRMIGDDKVLKAFWNTGLMRSLGRRGRKAAKPGRAPSYLERDNFALSLIEALRSAEPAVDRLGDGAGLFSRIDKNSPLYAVAQEIGIDHSSSVQVVKDAIGTWFDQVMDRASGVYKRYMSLVSFVAASAIVVATNADTLHIAKTLWRDDVLRAGFVEAAEDLTQEVDGEAPKAPDPEKIAVVTEALLPLPLGWSAADCAGTRCSTPTDPLAKGLGLLLTAFAVTLGAPFWFDLLSRFVALRNSGPRASRNRP